MNLSFKLTFLLIGTFALSFGLQANEFVRKTQLKTVQISISDSVPPYNMLEENIPDYPGIQVEIISTIMKKMGYQVQWKTMTNARAVKELTANRLDGAINVAWNLKEAGLFFESESIMNFQNCLIGKKAAAKEYPSLDKFNQMLQKNRGPRVMGFQGAAKVFAAQLPELKNYENYDEVPHQKLLVASLNAGRTRFVLSDYLVFRFYSRKILGDKSDFTCLHQIPSGPRNISFRDRSLRDQFNAELERFSAKGSKEKVIEKYQLFLSHYLKEGGALIFRHSRYLASQLQLKRAAN